MNIYLFLKKNIFIIWEIIMVWTAFLLFGCSDKFNVLTSKSFIIENAGFLFLGGVIVYVLFLINSKYGKQLELHLNKHSSIYLWFSLIALFTGQLVFCFGGYFDSGWDVVAVKEAVFHILNEEYDLLNNDYFSWFPNNLLLVWIYVRILRVSSMIIGEGNQYLVFSLVIFQIIMDVLCILLVYRVTYGITNSKRLAFLAYAISYLFVGLSPWFIVAYSDGSAFAFAMLIIRLYQVISRDTKGGKRLIILGFLMGFLSAIGLYIKPQTIIMYIAIICSDLCNLFKNNRKKNRVLFVWGLSSFVGFVLFIFVYRVALIPSLNFNLDSEKTIGWQHYLMMGMDVERDGVFSDEDYIYTKSFATNKERNHADLVEAKNRVAEMGVSGIIKHLSRKQLVNYGDGTFAWAVEGNSFLGDPEWANNITSPMVRAFIKPEGKYYEVFISVKQLFWVVIIFSLLFTLRAGTTVNLENENIIIAMVLSIIGLTVFELLFEARARYLFCYAPVYCILSTIGISNIYFTLFKYRH